MASNAALLTSVMRNTGDVSPDLAESSGAMIYMWLPAAIVGNLFALYWLIRALKVAVPGLSFRTAIRDLGSALPRRAKKPAMPNTTSSERDTVRVVDSTGPSLQGSACINHSDTAAVESPDAAAGKAVAEAVAEAPAGAVAGCAAGIGNQDAAFEEMDLIDAAALEELQEGGKKLHKVKLEWWGVGCTRSTPRGKVKVLQGVCGTAQPGQMMALLGPSGAGKSTLLDILAMRSVGGASASKVQGLIKVNGRVRTDTAGGACNSPSSHDDSNGAFEVSLQQDPADKCTTGAAVVSCQQGLPDGSTAHGDAGVNGRVTLYNGNPGACGVMSKSEFLRLTAYVPQEDHLLPQMTVHEVLDFHAMLLLPPGTTKAERRQSVEHALGVMGLQNQSHTMVGGSLLGGLTFRGISGGERKRLAIAAGVLAGPSLIFLDEPSSGLDSFSALSVAAYLRALANAGHALIVSIHQPRAAIWGLFDRVLLLSMGRMMFEGPVSEILPWFTGPKMGYRYEPDEHGVPSDWVIDLVSGAAFKSKEQKGKQQQQEEKLVQNHVQASMGRCSPAYKGSPAGGSAVGRSVMESPLEVQQAADAFAEHMAARNKLPAIGPAQGPVSGGEFETEVVVAAAAGSCKEAGQKPGSPAAETKLAQNVSDSTTKAALQLPRGAGSWHSAIAHGLQRWCVQFRALLWRESLVAVRNPTDVAGRMLVFVWIALISNLLVYGASGDASSMNQRVTWLFSLPFFYLVIPYVFMSLFTADKRAYMADVGARLYRPGPFYAAKVLSTFPINALIAILFGWIGYGMFGFRHSALSWIQSTACSVVFSLCSLQWMHLATCLAPNQDVAFALAVAFTIFNVLLNGFFLAGPADESLPGITKLRMLSALDWSWQGLMLAEFKDRVFVCPTSGPLPLDALQLFPEFLPNISSLSLIKEGLTQPFDRQGCVTSGNAVLDFFQIHGTPGQKLGALFVYLAVLHLLTFAALLFSTSKKRGN